MCESLMSSEGTFLQHWYRLVNYIVFGTINILMF